MRLISCPIITRATINGNTEDAITLFQKVETWINETIAVKLTRSLGFCQSLSIVKRETL